MTTIERTRIADTARSHLEEDAPKNTCMSSGMNKWPQELGLPGIGTASVSEGKARAQKGYNGWEYHTDLSNIEVGDFADWEPEVLGDPSDRHVSCVIEVDDYGRLKTIGAGGPTGKVFWQPQSQGFNPPAFFRGFFRAPLTVHSKKATTRTSTAPAKASSADTYRVKRGDILLRIAAKHDTTVGRLVKLNRLRNPDHIEVGQVLKLR